MQKDLLYLYGGDQDWNSAAWEAVDDRVRGGSSTSHLEPSASGHTARFYGHLDTSTLGGAGFASQSTAGVQHWDLSSYDGILLQLGKNGGDGKKYALTLKDEIPGQRNDGRMKSGVSWEAIFQTKDDQDIWLPWDAFKATYRGRPKDDAKPLQTHDVKRAGLMMRSFFDEQDGDFSLEIRGIAAAAGEGRTPHHVEPRRDSEEDEDLVKGQGWQMKDERHSKSGRGWRGVFCGLL